MKTWYLTREGKGELIHKGSVMPPGVKILLTQVQAQLHSQKITKTDVPKTAEEAFFPEEFEQFRRDSPVPSPQSPMKNEE